MKRKKSLFSEDLYIILILVFIGIISGLSFLGKGYFFLGDVWPHLSRVKIFANELKNLKFTLWSFHFYLGFPVLRFYGPLFFWGASIFVLFLNNLFSGVKIWLFIIHIFSFISAYYLGREYGEKWGGIIFSMFFGLNFWKFYHVMFMGRFTASLFYSLLPLAFYFLKRKKLYEFAIINTLLLLSHFGYFYFWLFFGILFSIFEKERFKTFIYGNILTLFLGISFILPFAVYTLKYKIGGLPTVFRPVKFLFLIKRGLHGGWHYGAYIGIILILMGIVGIITNIKRKEITFPFLLSVIFVFGFARIKFLKIIPMSSQFLPLRHIVYLIIFLGLGATILINNLKNKFKWIPLVISVFVFFDYYPLLKRNSFAGEENFLGRIEIYNFLKKEKNLMVLDTGDYLKDDPEDYSRLCKYPSCGFIFGNLFSPLGLPYHQLAPQCHQWVKIQINNLVKDLLKNDTILSKESKDFLSFIGIDYIILFPPVNKKELEFVGKSRFTYLYKVKIKRKFKRFLEKNRVIFKLKNCRENENVILPIAYYPFLKVKVNDKYVKYGKNEQGFLKLNGLQGDCTIEVTPAWEKARILSFILNVLFILIFVLSYKNRRIKKWLKLLEKEKSTR